MDYSDFTGEVQSRLELGTQADAVQAIRATLTTLGERIGEGEATDLAAPLPKEIDYYLHNAGHGERFGFDEFVERVAERADAEREAAFYYAQEILALMAENVPGSEIMDLRAQLPDEFDDLFGLIESDTDPADRKPPEQRPE